MLPSACVQWKNRLCGGADLMSGVHDKASKSSVECEGWVDLGIVSFGAFSSLESCQAHQAHESVGKAPGSKA